MSNKIVQVLIPDDLNNEFIVSEDSGVKLNIDNETIVKDSNGVISAKALKSVIRGVLGETLSSGTLVLCNNGLYYAYDNTNLTLTDRAVGFTNQTAVAGTEVDIVTEGLCPGMGSLIPNKKYFASIGGAITDIPPTEGIRMIVGTSISGTELIVKIKDSIIKVI